jgi:hypothetical protein
LLAGLPNELGNIFRSSRSCGVNTVRKPFRDTRSANCHAEASGIGQQSFGTVSFRVGKERGGGPWLSAVSVRAGVLDAGMDGRKAIAGKV